MDHYQPPSLSTQHYPSIASIHPTYPPWQVGYAYQYYGYPAPAGPYGWPPMPPWQGPASGAAGAWVPPPAMQAHQQSSAEVPYWLQPLTTAAAAAAAAAVHSNNNTARAQPKMGETSQRQQVVTEAVVRSPPGADEYSSDDDWLPESLIGAPASSKVQVHKVIYKVC